VGCGDIGAYVGCGDIGACKISSLLQDLKIVRLQETENKTTDVGYKLKNFVLSNLNAIHFQPAHGSFGMQPAHGSRALFHLNPDALPTISSQPRYTASITGPNHRDRLNIPLLENYEPLIQFQYLQIIRDIFHE